METFRLSVLLVKKDQNQASKLKSELIEQGLLVQTASDFEQAKKLSATEHFDVIATDASMPKNDGMKIYQVFNKDYPIVMLTISDECIRSMKLEDANICILAQSECHERLAQAVWKAFKRFRISVQLVRDAELAA